MWRLVVGLKHSTSFTAGSSLSITQIDWQFMKASAVMKSYSEAETGAEAAFLFTVFRLELKEIREGSHNRIKGFLIVWS